MAGRPHAGQLCPGVPTAQLHQPPRWFQVSDYPPVLYLARIEHSLQREHSPEIVIPQVPSQPPPLLAFLAPLPPRSPPVAFQSSIREGKSQAPAPQLPSSPAPQLQLQCLCSRLCTLPRQLVFHMLLFCPFFLLIRRALRLLPRPGLAGSPAMQFWGHSMNLSFLLSRMVCRPRPGQTTVRPGAVSGARTLDHARSRPQLRFGR